MNSFNFSIFQHFFGTITTKSPSSGPSAKLHHKKHIVFLFVCFSRIRVTVSIDFPAWISDVTGGGRHPGV